ncbi:MAG: PD-(D/E)XK nuclease family protein [Flammeovirgaceae bacterium]
MKPNLFRWATSELSQDAFLCWLLEWAKPQLKGEPLHKTATKFITELSSLDESEIDEIEVRKQYKNIDIVVVINKKSAILIEDKVHSKNHSNQLLRYAEILKEEFLEKELSLIYLKTGDQSNYRNVESKGYKIFKRNQFLKLLNEGRDNGVTNEIFIDFLNYLTNIDNSVNSFKTLPIDKWHWDSWKGFYIELQKRLGQGDWDYVPQKNGGFLGFWWLWDKMDFKETGFDFYLQLEHGKFCFKIIPYDVQLNLEIRNYYRKILFQFAQKNDLRIKRNGRCVKGKTKTMTVAKLTSSYIQTDSENIIDMDKTIEKIRGIENLMKEIKTAHNNG